MFGAVGYRTCRCFTGLYTFFNFFFFFSPFLTLLQLNDVRGKGPCKVYFNADLLEIPCKMGKYTIPLYIYIAVSRRNRKKEWAAAHS